jgi:hypothetical protein
MSKRLLFSAVMLLVLGCITFAQDVTPPPATEPLPTETALPAVPDLENLSTETISVVVAVVIAAAIVLSSLLGYSVYQLANSVPSRIALTLLANNRHRIPTMIDDVVLEVGLKLGKLRLQQRPDGQIEVVPVEGIDETITRHLEQITPKDN